MSDTAKISMEYEARCMINEKEFDLIKKEYSSFPNTKRIITNKNVYFETPSLYLVNHHMVLRLRHINNDKEELTLKIKGEGGDIEINYPLSKKETMDLIDDIEIPDSVIRNKLVELGVNLNSLEIVTTLFTERMEIDFPDHVFIIDKNFYNNKVDYNLEVESTSKEKAQHYLEKIVKPYGIKIDKNYMSKSRRAILKL